MIVNDTVVDPVFPFVLRCDGCLRSWFYSRATDVLTGLVDAADHHWTITIHPTADAAVDRHYCRLCTKTRAT